MTEFVRNAEENFANLPGFSFQPNYHRWQDLRMHYLDEGPKDAPVMLLLHGMPTWSFLYRDVIPGLVAAGYRCVAPDHMGFGPFGQAHRHSLVHGCPSYGSTNLVNCGARSAKHNLGLPRLGRANWVGPGSYDARAFHGFGDHEHVVTSPRV